MKSKQTLKFLGYYLTPFVLNCVGVFTIWYSKTYATIYITVGVTLFFDMLWVWFNPNESALPTALAVVVSWAYAWLLLLFYTFSPFVIWASVIFGFWFGVVGFVWALIIGNRYMRFNNGKRRYVWKVTDTAAGSKILVYILVISLFIAGALFCIKGPPITTNNNEVWIDYSEDEQMSKG